MGPHTRSAENHIIIYWLDLPIPLSGVSELRISADGNLAIASRSALAGAMAKGMETGPALRMGPTTIEVRAFRQRRQPGAHRDNKPSSSVGNHRPGVFDHATLVGLRCLQRFLSQGPGSFSPRWRTHYRLLIHSAAGRGPAVFDYSGSNLPGSLLGWGKHAAMARLLMWESKPY